MIAQMLGLPHRRFCSLIAVLGATGSLTFSGLAQTPPPAVTAPDAVGKPQAGAPPAPVNPLAGLLWDSTLKEQSPKPGQPTADFVFTATNTSDANIVIDHVQTSCGCTVAKLPSQPWVLAPAAFGDIKVTVNLAGKQGTFMKTVFVYATNLQFKTDLNLKVNMPENPAMARTRNQQMAMADQQSVFKGECATCHGDPVTHGLMGKELYQKACAVCHDASQRDSKVPDLHALTHATDLAFWKVMIANGKPATMMPGFSLARGGPLTDNQIESLAKICNQAFIPLTSSAPVKSRPVDGTASGLIPPPPIRMTN